MRTILRAAAVVLRRRRGLLVGSAARRPAAAAGTRRDPVAGEQRAAAPDRLAATIARAQDRLRTLPGDHATWAALGLGLRRAGPGHRRPSLYPKAEGALRRSLAVRPDDNAAALVGLGALANARHDFAAARRCATDALRSQPLRRRGVRRAGRRVDPARRRPGGHGRRPADARPAARPRRATPAPPTTSNSAAALAEATDLMRRALDAAVDPADIAFCRNQLGDLAWHAGDLAGAARRVRGRARRRPGLSARCCAAGPGSRPPRGHVDAAVADAGTVAPAYADPRHPAGVRRAAALRRAGPPRPTGSSTLADAAHAAVRRQRRHGRPDRRRARAGPRTTPTAAVRWREAEWRRRPFAEVADVLGWALHAAGRDAEALPYAAAGRRDGRRATPRYAYHLGDDRRCRWATGAAPAAARPACARSTPTSRPPTGRPPRGHWPHWRTGREASARRSRCLAVVGFLALPAGPAAAHPLGNFSVNRYAGLTLHPDRVDAAGRRRRGRAADAAGPGAGIVRRGGGSVPGRGRRRPPGMDDRERVVRRTRPERVG